jgi:tol-pal system protein YbgF
MKKILLLSVFSSVAFAQPKPLPPVIDNSSYPGGNPMTGTTGTPSNNALYEVLGRLEQMQIEVQQLRGIVEEQAQVIEDLKTRQGHIYSDFDQRLQSLTGNSLTTPGIPSASSQSKQQSAFVLEQPLASSAIAGKSAVNEKEMYQEAYETLRNGHNTQAIAAFNDLLQQFPGGEYADNAQYWLGEAYKVNQDIESAKVAFTKVIKLYPNSPKVPDALLKLGYIEMDQNNLVKARDYLTQVSVKYPGTTAAHLASKKILQMDQ